MGQRNENIKYMESRVQKYLAKKEKAQKSNIEVGEKSPLPTEELLQIFQKLKGKDGKTPKQQELLDLILPLIPDVKDGHTPTTEELLSLIAPLIPKIKDGKTPQKGKDYMTDEETSFFLQRATPIKGKHYFDGKDGKAGKDGRDAIMPSLRSLAISAINLLETFEGDDRLDVKAIKNIEKLIRMIVSQETSNYGGMGIVFHDATLTGDGTPTAPLKVVASGMGVNFETPVGLIDGLNTSFTVSNIPKAIILNGQTYFQDDGYTITSLTITMLITPVVGSTLRSMY